MRMKEKMQERKKERGKLQSKSHENIDDDNSIGS